MEYPLAKKVDSVDTYFGTAVPDPYRWLEDDRSADTEDWVKAQNEVTLDYLSTIPYRDSLKNRLQELWNYEKVTAPFKEGAYTYFYKNNGLQNQYVLYRFKNEGDIPEVFLDPNTFSPDGTTSLGNISFSKDGSLAAYTISEGGSDWRKVRVMDTDTKELVGDTLVDVKFSGLSWKGNKGFYYSSYDKPKGSELSAKTDQHKLYYHQLGTSQKEDQLVYGGTLEQKRRYVTGRVTEDDKYLLISASTTTSGNQLHFMNLEEENPKLITIVDNFDSDTYLLSNHESKFYLVTNRDAPNKKVVVVDATNPTPQNWKDLIPETKNVLEAHTAGEYIFAKYMLAAVSQVKQYDYSGTLVSDIKLPGLGDVHGFNGKRKDTSVYFSFTNYITPGDLYVYDMNEKSHTLYRKSKIDFDSDQYVSTHVFYNSKDGTKIPMTITHKKGVELDGKNPTILYGYGGFNISLTTNFSVAMTVWMEQGGIFAVPNLRGGGEFGKKWHDAGTKMQKQNVFDDFIAAGTYLIDKKYTSNDYLAIRGGSNGGLLVGATMTQRPDLIKVALPAVGVLDMLRYHTFTAGAGWSYDYGTAEDSKEMFEYLKNYSPVHCLKKNTRYPATLITTGDHDDRVVPAHSFKFAATLQECQTGTNPTLIRIETDAGHGAGTPVSKIIEQYADIFAFTLHNMGFESLNKKRS